MTTTRPVATTTLSDPARDRRLMRVAGGGLLASCGLMLTLWASEGPEHETVGAEEARSFLVDTVGLRDLAMHGSALLLVAFGITLAALWSLARTRDGDGILAGSALIGGLLLMVDWWLFGAITGLPVVVDDLQNATPEVARGWYALDKLQESFGDVGKAAQCLFLLGIGMVGLRSGLVHRPVAWLALALVASYGLSLVTYVAGLSAASTTLFLAGLFGLLFWFIAAGVSLLAKARRPV